MGLNSSITASRRTFLKTTSLAAIGSTISGRVFGYPAHTSGRILAFIGTDTKPVDGAANGKGIYVCELDQQTGELSDLKLAAETVSASWICLHPSKQFLYCVNEVSDYEGNGGSVSAFAIDRTSGALRLLNIVSSHGAGPTHMSVDATGKFAFVANYYGGSIAVFPIQPDGSLGKAVYSRQDEGSLGSMHGTDAPVGSFAISGHDGPHAHMISVDPTNRFVLQTDLGQDRIYVYRFDSSTGALTPAQTPYVSVPTGDGPRHFVFHPNGRWMYSIQEEASTLAFFHYDSANGSLSPKQTISALPPGFTGTNFCSEIMITPDGRFLYAANRLHNSVAVFGVGTDGTLHRVGEALTEGDYPNHVVLDPGGRNLYVCNQRSDQITMFRRDAQTGELAFTGKYLPLGTPMCMVFLT